MESPGGGVKPGAGVTMTTVRPPFAPISSESLRDGRPRPGHGRRGSGLSRDGNRMGLRAKGTRCRPGVEGLEGRVALTGAPAGPSGGVIVSRQPVAAVVDPAGAVTDVTDPRVVKQGGTYYLFSSGVGVPIR